MPIYSTPNMPRIFYSTAAHCAACVLIFAGIMLAQSQFPVFYAYFGMEDSWGEYGTFVGYLLSSFMVAWAMRVNRDYVRPGYALLAIAFFAIAMEEISWGQRLFGLPAPYIFAQYNDQAELTVHNLFVFRSTRADIFYYAIACWALLVPALSLCSQRLKVWMDKIGIPRVPGALMPYFALSIFVFKLGLILNSQEVSEQFFGIAFLLYSVEVLHQAHENAARPIWKRAHTRSVAIMAVALLTIFFVRIKPTEPRLKSFFLHQFAAMHYPANDLNKQAEEVFQYLMDNKEMKTDETLMQYGTFLQNIHDPKSESILLKALGEQKEQAGLQPEQSRPHHLAGKILTLLGQNDLAKQAFETAVTIDRNNLPNAVTNWEKVRTLESIAENYLAMGEPQKALEQLQRANEIVDDGWQKQEIRRSIEKIKQQY